MTAPERIRMAIHEPMKVTWRADEPPSPARVPSVEYVREDLHNAALTDVARLRAVLHRLCNTYASCNGEDHPAFEAARIELERKP